MGDQTNVTVDAETAKQQPETGAENAKPAAPENLEPHADSPAEPDVQADEIAKWKAMSRKNEKQAEANLKQMQQYQAELTQLKADNARLNAKNAHPQITDDVLALCDKTDPDEITAWAERYAKINPIHTSAPEREHSDPLARKVSRLAENPEGEFNPKPKPSDAYERSQARQKARARKHN